LQERINTVPNVSRFDALELTTGAVNDQQAPIGHVEAEFARLRAKGEYLGAHDGGMIDSLRYTSSGPGNYNGSENHFQGMQRLANGRFLVVSGGDWATPSSHLFVIKMGSRPKTGPWLANTRGQDKQPPATDKIVASVSIDSKMWHAGGMDVMGDVLAVPVEYPPPNTLPLTRLANLPIPKFWDAPRSRIVFFDMKNPTTPKRLKPTIDRAGVKSTAVALCKLPNGFYLAVVFSAAGLDFYLSKTKRFNSGFRKRPTRWAIDRVRALEGEPRKFDGYQTINLINQSDGRLYLVGLHNTSGMAPTLGGDNNADLFTVDIPGMHRKPENATDSGEAPVITRVSSVKVECKHRQCNMDAAAGVYVDRGNLIIYSAYHWRQSGILRFNEFHGLTRAPKETITQIGDAWIELFEKRFFGGRFLTVRGPEDAKITNFGRVRAQGSGFDNKVRAVRFQLPIGSTYRLFRKQGFTEKVIDLKGTGRVAEIPDLEDEVDETDISSARFV
jgi:hypothetical protein